MKIQRIVSLVGAFALALSLAACAAPSSSGIQSTAPEGGGSDKAVTLRFCWWGGDDRHEATLAVIEAYQKLHPNVSISAEYSGYDGYFEKLSTQMAGGTAADIVQYDASMTRDLLTMGDVFVDLHTMSDTLNTSDFSESFLESFSVYNGKMVGLPTGLNAGIWLVNGAVTDAAQVTLRDDMTWDELIEAGKQLHAANPEQYLLNYDIMTLGKESVYSLIAQITGKEMIDLETKQLNFTRDDLHKVFSLYDRLYRENVMEPAADSAPYESQINTNPKWISGDLASCLAVTSQTNSSYFNFQDTAAVYNMPQFADAKENGVILRPAQLIGISSSCKEKEIAADFLNFFFNSEEAAKILKDCRSIPATAQGRTICEQEGFLDPTIVQAVEKAQTIATGNQNLSVPNEISDILKDATAKIAYQQGTVESIADDTMRALEDALTRI